MSGNSIDNPLSVMGFSVSLIGVILGTITTTVMAGKVFRVRTLLTAAVFLSNISCFISCLANLINFSGYSISCEVYMWFGGGFWGANVIYSVLAMNERAKCVRQYPKKLYFVIGALMGAMLAVLIYTRIISPGLMMENNVCAALWDKHWCLAAIYPIKMAADIVINTFFIIEVRNVINGSTNKGAAIRSIFVSSEIRLLLMFAFDITAIIIGMTTLNAQTDLMFYIATMWVDSTLLTASVFAKDIGHAFAGGKDTSIEAPKRPLKSSGGGKQYTLAPEKSGFSESRRPEA